MAEKTGARTINLFCPSLSKLATIVAWDDRRLDLGAIARTFGIEPSTLKLNGHFISRGVDLLASSVTWSSLLSFFSARGLSTGAAGFPALLVDGKLCKSGTKRAHDPLESENAECANSGLVVVNAYPQSAQAKKMRMKEKSSGSATEQEGATTLSNQGGLGMKRKLRVEETSPLKRSRTGGSYSNSASRSGAPHVTTCGYQSESVKRAREEEVLVGAACKRTRGGQFWIHLSCRYARK